jgi:hypothetical protein
MFEDEDYYSDNSAIEELSDASYDSDTQLQDLLELDWEPRPSPSESPLPLEIIVRVLRHLANTVTLEDDNVEPACHWPPRKHPLRFVRLASRAFYRLCEPIYWEAGLSRCLVAQIDLVYRKSISRTRLHTTPTDFFSNTLLVLNMSETSLFVSDCPHANAGRVMMRSPSMPRS